MKREYLFYLVLLLTSNLFSQDFTKSLKDLKTENQECLDRGKFMYVCSSEFYRQSDSILNVVYQYVRKNMNDYEKQKLKQEQLDWLRKRDKQYAQIENKDTGLGNGQDDIMVKNQEKAKITNERTRYLISKFVE